MSRTAAARAPRQLRNPTIRWGGPPRGSPRAKQS